MILYFLSLLVGKRIERTKGREKDVLTNIQEHEQNKRDRLIGVLDGRPIYYLVYCSE